jgi:hypothetical protein
MAKNEVLEAVIKDGKLYCGKCGEPLGIRDKYSEIAYEGEKYTQFIKLCSMKGCHAKSHYELRMSINKREIFIFPFEECKKIKEEKKVFKEEE